MNFTSTTVNIILAGCMFCALPTASAASSKSKVKASVPVTVSGQIFIVTKDRENIKLAFAKVAAIHEKEMLEHLKKKHGDSIEQREHLKSKLEAAIQEEEAADTDKEVLRIDWLSDSSKTNYENYLAAKETLFQKNRSKLDIQKKLIKFTSPESYMQDMPAPANASKTDADGNFTLTVPSGKYVIAATANRTVFEDTEQYYWLVRIDASSPVQSLMLSNDNQVETKCDDCVLLQ